MLRIALIYDTDRRYIFDFAIAQKVLKISEEDTKKLETALKKEMQKLT